MSSSTPHRRWTPAEYLAWERSQPEKHAFVDGEIFAMSGAKRIHNLVVANVVTALCNLLRDRPCEVYPSDMRVRVPADGSYTYPDASVVCSEPRFEDAEVDTLLNPEVVIEVLSPSTEAYDRGDKFTAYQSIASMSEFLLVSTRHRRVERFRRVAGGGWHLDTFEAGQRFELSVGGTLEVDDLYLKVPEGQG